MRALDEAARLEPDNGEYAYILAVAWHDSGHQQDGHVVLVDIANVIDGLAANHSRRSVFNVAKPDVRIEP